MMPPPVISVVTSSFNSGRHIGRFYATMRAVLEELDCTWEIIIVDDGSTDDSVAQCRAIAAADPGLTVIELSRNFGKEPALVEGLRHASGQLVFTLDSDLEEPPAALFGMLDVMRSAEVPIDTVYGIRERRMGSLQHTVCGSLFHCLFNLLSDVRVRADILPIRLMTRRYVDAVLAHRERALALVGLLVSVGFEQRPFLVEKTYKGYSSYTFSRRLAVALQYLIVYSSKPPLLMTGLGLGTVLLTVLYALYMLGFGLPAGEPFPGWAVGVVLILLLNGVLLTSVGMCGIYLTYIFQEVRQRPTAIVKAVYGARQGDLPPVPIPALKADRAPPPELRESANGSGGGREPPPVVHTRT